MTLEQELRRKYETVIKRYTAYLESIEKKLEGGGSPLLAYAIKQEDTTTTTNVEYYGFANTEGNWYILRIDKTTAIVLYTYARGDANFAASWGNRATTLLYSEFEALIWP